MPAVDSSSGASATASRHPASTRCASSTGYATFSANTSGPRSCSRSSNDVTTPKLPPPPRSAQCRSGCSSALARTWRPSARTTCAETRLSTVIPSRRRWWETPPLSARPATPVSDTTPPGVARPSGAVTRSTSAHVAPPCTCTVRPDASMRTSRIAERSITTPSSTMAVPATLCPPPRTESGSPRSAAKRMAVATSPGLAQRAIAAGRLSIMPFQTPRAASYSRWSVEITSPVRRSASATA